MRRDEVSAMVRLQIKISLLGIDPRFTFKPGVGLEVRPVCR